MHSGVGGCVFGLGNSRSIEAGRTILTHAGFSPWDRSRKVWDLTVAGHEHLCSLYLLGNSLILFPLFVQQLGNPESRIQNLQPHDDRLPSSPPWANRWLTAGLHLASQTLVPDVAALASAPIPDDCHDAQIALLQEYLGCPNSVNLYAMNSLVPLATHRKIQDHLADTQKELDSVRALGPGKPPLERMNP